MPNTRTCIIAVLACAAIVFSGCVDFTEEFFFHADGTGRMIVDVAMASALMSMGSDSSTAESSESAASKARMARLFKDDARVSGVQVRDTTYGGLQHTLFQIDAKSFNDLPALHSVFFADTEMASADLGAPEIMLLTETAISGSTTVKLDFIIPRDSAMSAEENLDFGESIANAMMGGSAFTFKVHGPKITSANGEIDSAAQTVEWKIPLGEMKHSPGRTLHAVIEIPGAMSSSSVMKIGLIAGVAAAVIIFVVVAKRRKKAA